jgi:hypothetical protein
MIATKIVFNHCSAIAAALPTFRNRGFKDELKIVIGRAISLVPFFLAKRATLGSTKRTGCLASNNILSPNVA